MWRFWKYPKRLREKEYIIHNKRLEVRSLARDLVVVRDQRIAESAGRALAESQVVKLKIEVMLVLDDIFDEIRKRSNVRKDNTAVLDMRQVARLRQLYQIAEGLEIEKEK